MGYFEEQPIHFGGTEDTRQTSLCDLDEPNWKVFGIIFKIYFTQIGRFFFAEIFWAINKNITRQIDWEFVKKV